MRNAGARTPPAMEGRMAEATKSILVVDDDVGILRLVREALAARLPFEVDATPSPEYAFELVLRKHYDLLLFDYRMPAVDGALLYAFIARLHAHHPPRGRRQPPLLLMSGHAVEKNAQELLRQPGVRGLLAKPFSIDRLVEKVSACLG